AGQLHSVATAESCQPVIRMRRCRDRLWLVHSLFKTTPSAGGARRRDGTRAAEPHRVRTPTRGLCSRRQGEAAARRDALAAGSHRPRMTQMKRIYTDLMLV